MHSDIETALRMLISEETLQELKAAAALRSESVQTLVQTAIEEELLRIQRFAKVHWPVA